jgi:hypothetical protein
MTSLKYQALRRRGIYCRNVALTRHFALERVTRIELA